MPSLPAARRTTSALVVTALVLLAAGPAVGAHDDDVALSTPREDSYYPRVGEPDIDALHYGLTVSWAPRTSTLTGTTVIRFRAARDLDDAFVLDLGNSLQVSSVRLDGAAVGSEHPAAGHLLRVTGTGDLVAGSRHVLRVDYAGVPERVPAPSARSDIGRLGWKTTRDGDAWTMQEPYGAFTWYPVNDHPSDKAFYDIRLDTPRSVRGVANGRLVSEQVGTSRRTTHFRISDPAASYLVTMAIGDYRGYDDRGPHGLPITYWLRPVDRDLLPELRRTPAMLRWLEQRLGRYPFATAGAVFVPSQSAIETQQTVTMGNGRSIAPRVPEVLLHEYSHQWYGDTVTPADWRELWLNESFAMYLQIVWESQHGGVTVRAYMRYIRRIDNELREQDGPPGAYDPERFGGSSVYYSGALMLHELRTRTGAAQFDRVLRAWPQRHAAGNADRGGYLDWLNRFTGRHLRPFMLDWLLSETTPGS